MSNAIKNESHKQPFHMACQGFFSSFARGASHRTGRASSFALALIFFALWGACGPLLGYSVAWQVTIDTVCSIVTLLMVLLIQNTQNRDTQAIQMKLDELIQTSKNARNDLIEVEKLTEGEIQEVREIQREIREQSEIIKPEKI